MKDDIGGQTHARILQAALELFSERGFAGTGIRDIAKASGLKSSGLYHYMETKDDLLFEIIQQGLVASFEASNQSIAGVDNPIARIVALIATTVIIHAEYQRTYLVIDNEFHFLHGDTLSSTITLRDQIDTLWNHALADGLAANAFTINDPNLTRLSLLSMYGGIVHWYSPRGSASVPELAARLADLGLAMLRVDRRRARAHIVDSDSAAMTRIVEIVRSTHLNLPV